MTFKDHFSGHAGDYARYRPHYPQELFQFLASVTPARSLAWDCATGNGQAALGLAGHFERVLASDASLQQVSQAKPHPRIQYVAGAAERAPIRDRSIDITTVAQALHWFDLDGFYSEVQRISRPKAILAAWSYADFRSDPAVDAVIQEFYNHKVGPYWPPERCVVEAGYQSLEFPFARLPAPAFEMSIVWDLQRTLDYLRTWSATRRYQAAHHRDPVAEMEEQFIRAWGRESQRTMRWKLTLLVGKVEGAAPNLGRSKLGLSEGGIDAPEPN